jgi:hypothetical protein
MVVSACPTDGPRANLYRVLLEMVAAEAGPAGLGQGPAGLGQGTREPLEGFTITAAQVSVGSSNFTPAAFASSRSFFESDRRLAVARATPGEARFQYDPQRPGLTLKFVTEA